METKIKDFLCRMAFFAADGMGEEKLVEFAKQAEDLLLEMARQSTKPTAVPNEMFVSEFAPRTLEAYARGWNECRAIVAANLGDRVQVPAELVGGGA